MFSKTRHIPALALTCMLAGLAVAETAPASQPGVAQLRRQMKRFNKQINRSKR